MERKVDYIKVKEIEGHFMNKSNKRDFQLEKARSMRMKQIKQEKPPKKAYCKLCSLHKEVC